MQLIRTAKDLHNWGGDLCKRPNAGSKGPNHAFSGAKEEMVGRLKRLKHIYISKEVQELGINPKNWLSLPKRSKSSRNQIIN